MNPLHIAVLGSTRGTHLQTVLGAIAEKKLNARVCLVVSNKPDALILERAQSNGLKSVFLNPKEFASREQFDSKLGDLVESARTDIILLAGYMRILSPPFCRRFENRILNIHPSLLPEFAGGMDLNVHEAVLKAGRKETGCTLHLVSEGVDAGPVILQQKVPVKADDTPNSLKERVQQAEREVIVQALKWFSEKRIHVQNGKVIVDEN
ncbi:MAG: phosphoribosylglycinamide formyltransferase [Candidatus Diapherotrites archaeon]|nr:phosphoribosylglycinamide formyltransferase [Candidatus Diapherotrites archaeon]